MFKLTPLEQQPSVTTWNKIMLLLEGKKTMELLLQCHKFGGSLRV